MKQDDRSGLVLALAGYALLSTGDAVIKTMSGEWPPTAIAALRYCIGAAGLCALLFARHSRAGFVLPRPGIQLLRGAGVAIATVGFFSAIMLMPLAEATAITFTSPMLTALLAAVFLHEPARRQTWIATVIAFAGVLMVLRPNFAQLGVAALLPLASAAGTSALIIGNRVSRGLAGVLTMQMLVAVIAAPLLILFATIGHFSGIESLQFTVPDWTIVARCAVVAVTATSAHWLIYLGTTRAGAASIAPMAYVQLIVASTLGWLLFGDRPDAETLLGAGIIVAAGLYLWRGAQRR